MEGDDRDADRRWPRSVYGVGREPDPRFTFANERTFLAWIRTALGFLAAGVGLSAVVRISSGVGPEVKAASLLLVTAGLGSGVSAFLRWQRNERALRLGRPLPASPMLVVLTVLVVLAATGGLLVVGLS